MAQQKTKQAVIKVAVLDDYDGSISRLDCWNALGNGFHVDLRASPPSDKELADYDVVVTVRERTKIDREFLARAKNLKHLALTGRLSGQADLEALKANGVSVSYTDGSGGAAAELTIGQVLGVMKGLHTRDREVKVGMWHNGMGQSLAGKTLGILGLGRVGTKVALFGKLMDMNVVSWGPTPDNGRSEKLGVQRLALEEVFKQSDVVAVCLRLSDLTKGLIGERELSLLKDGAALVNTSRAEIIERAALYRELESGRIRGAFDVYHTEPLPSDDPIRAFPNVLLSPHMGYVTEEVYRTFFTQVVENIGAWSNGTSFRNALTE